MFFWASLGFRCVDGELLYFIVYLVCFWAGACAEFAGGGRIQSREHLVVMVRLSFGGGFEHSSWQLAEHFLAVVLLAVYFFKAAFHFVGKFGVVFVDVSDGITAIG